MPSVNTHMGWRFAQAVPGVGKQPPAAARIHGWTENASLILPGSPCSDRNLYFCQEAKKNARGETEFTKKK